MLKNAFGGSSDTTLKTLRDTLLKIKSDGAFPLDELNKSLEIEVTMSNAEIEDLLTCKYRGKYTYLVLSLLYPDRDWKDTVFHEDHIFPDTEFGVKKLKKRGYDGEKIKRYLAVCNTVLNLELLTDTDNLSKSSLPFDLWIVSRDDGFKKRHLIPERESYDLDDFENFIEARKKLLVKQLKTICPLSEGD